LEIITPISKFIALPNSIFHMAILEDPNDFSAVKRELKEEDDL
jgi:hypothetical protein